MLLIGYFLFMSTENESCEIIIIGAGIVGLAIAAHLSGMKREVIVLESEKDILQHASSHNSEVIHSGVYYPNDSLKANLCVEGNDLLYAYCKSKGVAHNKIGKLIVASHEEELEVLKSLSFNGKKNGVKGLKILDQSQIKEIEPQLKSKYALLVESTGVIDSHEFALSLMAEIESSGNHVITLSPVKDAAKEDKKWKIKVGGESPFEINSKILINSSGYNSVDLARQFGVKSIPSLTFVKGHYYKYHGKNPFSHLIYPLPEKNGLGIHTSTDTANTLRFGPDAELIKKPDYIFNHSHERLLNFTESIKKYFEGFQEDLLHEDFCGVRARLGSSHNEADFSILFEENHGIHGLINLSGIESPGLTSALSIAKYVCKKI